MPDDRTVLTLAHSPDPDDAFMWWPITGKMNPRTGEALTRPAIDTGRFRFRSVPADIEMLNRRAAREADLDVTALSARAYADVTDRYVLTSCGGSFGDGYGPKVVCRRDSTLRCDGCLRGQNPLIAIPGERTTAFLVLSLLVGGSCRFIEMPFEKIVGAVARGDAQAGLIIHEAQLTFGDAGLRQIVDLGAWWKERTGLPLPLGVNAVRRNLDHRFGPGSAQEIATTLHGSVTYAMARRAESIDHALEFAMLNDGVGGIDRARVERFVDMYVNSRTLDMGDAGREAIDRLLTEGARAGLCPAIDAVEVIPARTRTVAP
jgi:1,4-dihydroxy-6-naphthoate synthase